MKLSGRLAGVWLWVTLVAVPLAACSGAASSEPQSGRSRPAEKSAPAPKVSGDVNNGKQLFASKGCIACHAAPGVAGATGTIGPSLGGIGDPGKRPQLAAGIPNTPDNIRRWIKDPASVKAGTMMPNLNLNDKEADDLVAFLVTLR